MYLDGHLGSGGADEGGGLTESESHGLRKVNTRGGRWGCVCGGVKWERRAVVSSKANSLQNTSDSLLHESQVSDCNGFST